MAKLKQFGGKPKKPRLRQGKNKNFLKPARGGKKLGGKPKQKRPNPKQPPRQKPPPNMPRPQPPAAQKPEQGRPANNTTCDIWHSAGAGNADVANVAINLTGRFQQGGEASEGDTTFRWTHVATMASTTDVRDNYPAAPNTVLKVPTGGATVFDIVFVELVNRGLPTAYKRVFLDRQEPTWPTDVV